MWRLTVERNYKFKINEIESDATDRTYFEADDFFEIERILEWHDSNAVDGKYVYIIHRKEEGGEEC